MENMCNKLDRMEKHSKEVGTNTYDANKVWVELKSNNHRRAERLRWVDYKTFEDNIDDIGDIGFMDETMGYKEGF